MQVAYTTTRQIGSVCDVVLDICGSAEQLEVDIELSADAGWDTASDQEVWRVQWHVTSQVVQWVS